MGKRKGPAEDLRRHQVNCRLSDSELARLDQGRPEGVTRGEWMRRKALARKLPPSIPAISRKAWTDLGRSLGSLSTVGPPTRPRGEF
jgi:hypothetical protein